MSESNAIQRPRVRAAAVYALLTITALYLVYRYAHPGWPFSLLLSPALLGNGLLLALLSGTGMDIESGWARALAWVGGALVMGYVYYKLIYLLLWLFGIHQPIKAGAADDGAPVRDTEGGWVARVLLVAAIPTVLAFFVWRSATDRDNQYDRHHELIRTAAEVACAGNAACELRVGKRFDRCFDAHFVRQGRRWLRPHYAIDREPFRACLHGAKRPASS